MSLLTHPRFMEAATLHRQGRFEEAGRIYQELIEENPNDPDLWHFKGLLALHCGNPQESVRLITLAIVIKPGVSDYFQNLGIAYEVLGNKDKAAESFNKAGNACQEQCRFADALPLYHQALVNKPGFIAVLINKGAALDRLGRYGEAAAAFNNALTQLSGDEPGTLLNIANALSGLGRSAEAVEVYTRLLEAEPDNATAHCSRSLLLLRLGRMAEGWKEYEWRWSPQGGFHEPRGKFKQPMWQGETPAQLGGSLLVIAEQGLGDIIQFARYLPLLAERGYDIIFEVLPELTTLFREGFDHPGIRVIPRIDDPLTVEGDLPFAAWVGVMSLPDRFGTITETVPAQMPYLNLATDKVARWQERLETEVLTSPRGRGRPTEGWTGEGLDPAAGLAPHPPGPRFANAGRPLPQGEVKKVGIVWAGNPKNLNDFARSIPAELLGPLLAVEGVTFFSLQKGPAADYPFPEGSVVKLGPDLTDFTETAAAILALDLVIAVDTSVCHMAGALERPVWLLLPQTPDWRWLNEGETSIWYPTMRIFRQTVRGEWGDVIAQVAGELAIW